MEQAEIDSRLMALFTGEGWPMVVRLFQEAEGAAIVDIRAEPLGQAAVEASVRLAFIEELRNMLRSAAPDIVGDPFVSADHPQTWYGPAADPESDADADADDDDDDSWP